MTLPSPRLNRVESIIAGRFSGPAFELTTKLRGVGIAQQPCNLLNGQFEFFKHSFRVVKHELGHILPRRYPVGTSKYPVAVRGVNSQFLSDLIDLSAVVKSGSTEADCVEGGEDHFFDSLR